MTFSHSEILRIEVQRKMNLERYKSLCEALVSKWYALLSYNDMEEWFNSNKCCIPLSLIKLLRNGKNYIKEYTTI